MKGDDRLAIFGHFRCEHERRRTIGWERIEDCAKAARRTATCYMMAA